jgi:outer membrane protein assembly factor BamB
MRRFVLGILAAWSTATLAIAAPIPKADDTADWLEFRGPDGTGHYKGAPLPIAWGPDKNVTWKTPIPGAGWSSPILLRGKLVLTTAVPVGDGEKPDYELRALCIDAKSGKIEWNELIFLEKGATTPIPHKKNSHASPTAVSDGERIVVHFGHMGTAALDLTGKILWKNDKYPYEHQHGNGASPILAEGNVVFSCDAKANPFVLALDIKTGKEAWKTDRAMPASLKFSFATSQLIEHKGVKMIVSPASDYCAAYDPKTGKEIWRVKYPKPGWSLICRPVYSNGLVFVATGYVNQHMIAIDPSGTGDLTDKVAWKTSKFAPNTPTPLAVGDELYMLSDQGTLSCLDAKTGTVHWSERIKGGAFSSSPILADGLIYITSESGVGQVVKANKAKLEVVSESDMKEKTFASFVPSGGALYLRTETALFKFESKKKD